MTLVPGLLFATATADGPCGLPHLPGSLSQGNSIVHIRQLLKPQMTFSTKNVYVIINHMTFQIINCGLVHHLTQTILAS